MKESVLSSSSLPPVNLSASPSKSEAIRLSLLNALLGKTSFPTENRDVFCDDTQKAIACADLLAARGKGPYDCGESATLAHLLLPCLGALGIPAEVTVSERLSERLDRPFLSLLEKHGMTFRFPSKTRLQVEGTLRGEAFEVEAAGSSQPLSGLLLAFSATAGTPVTVTPVGEVVSLPYVRMTEKILLRAGADLTKNGKSYSIRPAPVHPLPFTPDGDFSSAVYPLLCGLRRPVAVRGLSDLSAKADAALLPLLRSLGVSVTEAEDTVTVLPPSSPLPAFSFDGKDSPDLLLPLSVLAAFTNGESTLSGFDRLKKKECDRSAAAVSLLAQMKIPATLDGDGLTVIGGSPAVPAAFDLPADHRAVMSAYLAAFLAGKETTVASSDCVRKSYPRFFEDMTLLGLKIKFPK